MAEDTFYCSFVGNHYIICECGDNFPSEEALRVHIENKHFDTIKTEIRTEPECQKVVKIVKSITANNAPKRKPQPKQVILVQAVNLKLNEEYKSFGSKEESYVLHLPEPDGETPTKQEVKTFEIKQRLPVVYAKPQSAQINVETQKEIDDDDHDDHEDTCGQESPSSLEYMVENEYTDGCSQEADEAEDQQLGLIGDVEHDLYKQEESRSSSLEQGDEEIDYQVQEAVHNLLEQHLKEDHDYNVNTEYYCEMCGRQFPTEDAVDRHIHRMHSRNDKFVTAPAHDKGKLKKGTYIKNLKNIVCEVCGKKYASNAALRYHQRVHTGERPYECPMCPKTFTMPLFLQIHVRTHTGERPYQCQLCPKSFSNKAALLRHDRVHTGIKPYPCPKCGKTFTQSNSMKLHVKTVHLKQPAPYKSKARKMKQLLKLQAQGKLDDSQEKQLYESLMTQEYTENKQEVILLDDMVKQEIVEEQ